MAKDKTWRDRVEDATWRGFKFLAESHDASAGQRLVVTKFPGRDVPSVQDLGADADGWKLTAYFLGDNYDLERNGFVAKLAQPGADWLTHPWLGRKWVRAHKWQIHDAVDKTNLSTVTVEFVPGGEVAQPQADKVDVAYDRIAAVATVVADEFALKPMSSGGMTAFVAAVQKRLEALRSAISTAALPLTQANQIKTLLLDARSELGVLMATPASYAAMMQSMVDEFAAMELLATSAPRVVSRLSAAAVATGAHATGLAAISNAVTGNLSAEQALRSNMLLAAAAHAAMTDYDAEADRDAALASLVAAIDAKLPSMSDAAFAAAVDMRAAVVDALQAQDIAATRSRMVAAPMPVAVLAYQMGVTEAVFAARNRVRHPLFIVGEVQV